MIISSGMDALVSRLTALPRYRIVETQGELQEKRLLTIFCYWFTITTSQEMTRGRESTFWAMPKTHEIGACSLMADVRADS